MLLIFPISQKSCRFFRTENSTGSYCRSGDIFPFTAIPITWSARHLNAILRSDVQTHVCHPSHLALRAGPPMYAIIYKKRHIGILATFTQVAYTSSRHPPHHVPSQESRIWTQEATFNATSHHMTGMAFVDGRSCRFRIDVRTGMLELQATSRIAFAYAYNVIL